MDFARWRRGAPPRRAAIPLAEAGLGPGPARRPPCRRAALPGWRGRGWAGHASDLSGRAGFGRARRPDGRGGPQIGGRRGHATIRNRYSRPWCAKTRAPRSRHRRTGFERGAPQRATVLAISPTGARPAKPSAEVEAECLTRARPRSSRSTSTNRSASRDAADPVGAHVHGVLQGAAGGGDRGIAAQAAPQADRALPPAGRGALRPGWRSSSGPGVVAVDTREARVRPRAHPGAARPSGRSRSAGQGCTCCRGADPLPGGRQDRDTSSPTRGAGGLPGGGFLAGGRRSPSSDPTARPRAARRGGGDLAHGDAVRRRRRVVDSGLFAAVEGAAR